MKHYFNPMSRGMTTDWMLKELDVPHENIVIDFAAGANYAPEFIAINPMAKIPALVDGDTVVTEVAAICAYLADKFSEKQLAPTPGSPARGSYYRYLFLTGNTIEPAFALASAGLEHPEPISVGWGDTTRVLATIESMTPATGWALGEQFSAADIVFGGLLDFATAVHWFEATPKVAAYVERLRARPAYRDTHAAFATPPSGE